jgi:ribulose 1,5-bisphosphate synthetase/thiazole synthase
MTDDDDQFSRPLKAAITGAGQVGGVVAAFAIAKVVFTGISVASIIAASAVIGGGIVAGAALGLGVYLLRRPFMRTTRAPQRDLRS